MSSKSKTHINLILDRSGSMMSIREDAIGMVNGYIDTAKHDRALYEASFSMITFNSESVDTIRRREIMETVRLVRSEEYRPDGLTPLYDAIGRGIGMLDQDIEGKPEDKAILVVMTDGQENASREFNHAQITALIRARQEKGWHVVFLGAGLDVARQGEAMGVMADKVAMYIGGAGLRAAGKVLAASSARYVKGEEAGLMPKERDDLFGKK